MYSSHRVQPGLVPRGAIVIASPGERKSGGHASHATAAFHSRSFVVTANFDLMSNLSPRDREQLSQLDTITNKVRHVHGLVEQFASSPPALAEDLAGIMRRTFTQIKLQCTTGGFDRLAQICSSMEMTSRRGTAHGVKARALREGVGTLTRQVDLERRSINNKANRSNPAG